MKTYTILIKYQTGNSFGCEYTEDEVGYSWTDLNKAKGALCRIRDHYKAYQEDRQSYRKDKKEYSSQPWFTDESYWQHSLFVEKDDGSPQQISAFWVGYFERLYSAEIIVENDVDNDMKIEFY